MEQVARPAMPAVPPAVLRADGLARPDPHQQLVGTFFQRQGRLGLALRGESGQLTITGEHCGDSPYVQVGGEGVTISNVSPAKVLE